MAAFTVKNPDDHEAFRVHWRRLLEDPDIMVLAIAQEDGKTVGHVMSYAMEGSLEVTYWLGREYWGRGLATRALSEFLRQHQPARPIYARAAADNTASIRVLTKCGFVLSGRNRDYANARGAEIEECVFCLGGAPAEAV